MPDGGATQSAYESLMLQLTLTHANIYAKEAELHQGDLNHKEQVSAVARGSLGEGRSVTAQRHREASSMLQSRRQVRVSDSGPPGLAVNALASLTFS